MPNYLSKATVIVADCCATLNRSVCFEDVMEHYENVLKPIVDHFPRSEKWLITQIRTRFVMANLNQTDYFRIDESKLPDRFVWNTQRIDSLIKLEVFRSGGLKELLQKI